MEPPLRGHGGAQVVGRRGAHAPYSRSLPSWAAAWLRRGSWKSSRDSACFHAAEVVAAGGRLDPRPQRLAVAAGHDRVAQPAVELVAPAHHSRSVGERQQRPGVVLGRLAHRAAAEHRLHAADVALDRHGQPVGLGGDRHAELAQPRDLAADARVRGVVAVEVGPELLGRAALRAAGTAARGSRPGGGAAAACARRARAAARGRAAAGRSRRGEARARARAGARGRRPSRSSGSANACAPEGSVNAPPQRGSVSRAGPVQPSGREASTRPLSITSARGSRPSSTRSW